MLSNHFSQISDLNFTAKLEDELDEVAQGELGWREMLSAFYGPFSENLLEAAEKMPRQDIPTGETCELCGKPMNLKKNRWGSTFLSCSGFPECRNAKSTQIKTGVSCPDCGGDLMERKAKKGKRRSTFYGCSNYPTCNFAVNQKPLPEPCPECSGLMVQRGRNTAKCTKCAYSEPLGSSEQAQGEEQEAEAVEA
jgi:DNA topoisomerase-1